MTTTPSISCSMACRSWPSSATRARRSSTGPVLLDPSPGHLGHDPLAQVGLERVEPLERGDRDEDLPADLDDRRVSPAVEPPRHAGQPHRVGGDVLADPAVAAGRGADEPAVLVAQGERQAVDLDLGEPPDVAPRRGTRLLAPRGELLGREDVVEAEHALGVLDRRELGAAGSAHREGRRVLTLDLGVQPLERLEPVHPAVVGLVVDPGVVVAVVRVAGLVDALDELLGLGTRLVEGQVQRVLRGLGHVVHPRTDLRRPPLVDEPTDAPRVRRRQRPDTVDA